MKYICPYEDETVCTCKSLPECHPIANLVKAKEFNELNKKQICGFDELIAKYCCPTAKTFMPLENSSNIEKASASLTLKTVTTESSKQNGNLGEPKSFSKGLFAKKIIPIYIYTYIYCQLLQAT